MCEAGYEIDEDWRHFFAPGACFGHGGFRKNVVAREIAHDFGRGHGFALTRDSVG